MLKRKGQCYTKFCEQDVNFLIFLCVFHQILLRIPPILHLKFESFSDWASAQPRDLCPGSFSSHFSGLGIPAQKFHILENPEYEIVRLLST